MNLFDLIPRPAYEAAVAEKLISVRSDGAGLRILNYSDAALYTPGAWDNPAVRVCRGVIIDDDWKVRARPWAKFFNHGQVEAGPLDLTAPVEVTDKLDGSLGIIHVGLGGQPRVASRGSFESDQAIHATAVLLGGVVIETGEYLSPLTTAIFCAWPGPVAEVFEYDTLRDALAAADRPGMEGLCVRYLNESRIVKVKQDDYVRLHRIVTGLSERTVWEHMTEEKPLEDLLGPLPDELHDWTRHVWDRLAAATMGIYIDAAATHDGIIDRLDEGWTRRDFAEQAKQHAPLTPYLFQLLDGRDPRPAILQTLKPAGDTRARAFSEAVA